MYIRNCVLIMRNKLQYKIGMKKGFRVTAIIALICVALIGFCAQYSHKETRSVTIQHITEQQHVSGSNGENGGGVSTYYNYIVSTDIGVYEIRPDGIFASRCFGTIKEGKRYQITTRGFSFPLLGMYPYIIEAIPI